jgi:hypothetical protein
VNGLDFDKGARLNWIAASTTTLSTTFVSSTQLTASVPANLIAETGTATITISTNVGTSNSKTFDIVSASGPACANDGSGNAQLNGAYSFQFTQIDPTNKGQLNFNVGSFTADGNGDVSGKAGDANGPYFAGEEQLTFNGTYSVGSDSRGLLTLKYGNGISANFCFALDTFSSGVAGSGHLVSDQTNPRIDSGWFASQGSSNLTPMSVKGSWVFGLQGIQLDSNGDEARGAAAGYVALDGNGNVSGGEMDTSQDSYPSNTLTNTYQPAVSVSGTYTLASTGRGTMTLNLTGGGTNHYAFYVAGTNQIYLISTDTGGEGGATVMAGTGYLRPASISFGNSTLAGSSVFEDQALTNTNSSDLTYINRLVQVGILSWNGAGKYSESYDQNDAGDVSPEQSLSSTYAVDSDGRITLNGTSPAQFGYLVGPGQGFAIQGNLGVSLIYFEEQTVPDGGFDLSSFEGDYSQGSLWYSYISQKVDSGEIVASGTGGLSGNLDVAPLLGGTVESVPVRTKTADDDLRQPKPRDTDVVNETYTSSSSGRFLVTGESGVLKALYLVSTEKAYEIDVSGAAWLPIEEMNHQ